MYSITLNDCQYVWELPYAYAFRIFRLAQRYARTQLEQLLSNQERHCPLIQRKPYVVQHIVYFVYPAVEIIASCGGTSAEVFAPSLVRSVEHGLTRCVVCHCRFPDSPAVSNTVLNVFIGEPQAEHRLRKRRLHVQKILCGSDNAHNIHRGGREPYRRRPHSTDRCSTATP